MKKLIVIAGPTASGKTDLAIALASHFNTKILSADSRQCYRELNIGVAKPSTEQLQAVQHYFINSHSIHDEVSAGMYERYALDSLNEIFKSSDIAICVGGTGMYVKALCDGIDEMPSIQKELELELQNQYTELGLEWLQHEVELHDKLFFANGETSNPHRLLRALCFKLSTGTSIINYRKGAKKQRDFEIVKFAIDIDKAVLYNRINQRVDRMMKEGLLDEVKQLISFKDLKSLATVGYTELFQYLANECSYEFAVDKIKQHTRNYAKRQLTWFRHQADFQFISSDSILKALSFE